MKSATPKSVTQFTYTKKNTVLANLLKKLTPKRVIHLNQWKVYYLADMLNKVQHQKVWRIERIIAELPKRVRNKNVCPIEGQATK